MADYDVPAAVEETAKAVQSLSETSRSLGGYLAAVLGEAPFTAMAIIDDRLKFWRAERVIEYYKRATQKLQDARLDLQLIRLPSPSIELPLLEAATLEDRDELVELWGNLLAAAMHPQRRNRVRAKHVDILRRLEPLDAVILLKIYALIKPKLFMERDKLASKLVVDQDICDAEGNEILVSIEGLLELGLIEARLGKTENIFSTAAGGLFLGVVAGIE